MFLQESTKDAWHALGLRPHELIELLLQLCFTLPLWLILKPRVVENLLSSMGAILSMPTPPDDSKPAQTLASFFRAKCAGNAAAAHGLVLTMLGTCVYERKLRRQGGYPTHDLNVPNVGLFHVCTRHDAEFSLSLRTPFLATLSEQMSARQNSCAHFAWIV
jgi:hypothetical protein